jgi:ankyrin repeat protein
MFPNPQDALPFPRRPNLERYKKVAKELLKAAQANNPDGLREWASRWVVQVVRQGALEDTPGLSDRTERWTEQVTEFAMHSLLSDRRKCRLTSAQFVIARSHGFSSWQAMKKHIAELERRNTQVTQFEAAADAVVRGDIQALNQLLEKNPALARERSAREHRATLLHYTAANGVEGYRQQTPKNIVAIADLLLKAGADIEAEADVYGGGCTTLGLAATSIHPRRAGVQEPLLQLLLDSGASINKRHTAGNNHPAVIACLANGQPQAGEFLADRGAELDLESAAGIGRMAEVAMYFDSAGQLRPPATREQMQRGFLWACMYGREDVAVYLLDRGADLPEPGESGATGLHWAAGGGHTSLVRLLLARGAPLEALNMWGGTVIEHAGHGFKHGSYDVDFAAVFETLLAAGAKIRGDWLGWFDSVKERPVEERTRVKEIFSKYGATGSYNP